MNNWRFLDRNIALAIHEEQLAAHGGTVGMRDDNALVAALERAPEIAAQEPAQERTRDAARLAAAYAFGVTRNHPFVNGKKRVALVIMELFLADNGYELHAPDEDCVMMISRLAARDLDEAGLAEWLYANVIARGHSTSTS